jgi:hypothetical protein
MMIDKRTGGCLCGAVRYEVEGPPAMVLACHCKNCQRQSGSALSTIAAFPRSAVTIKGTLTAYHDTGDSGGAVVRKFCAICGSPVVSDILQDQFAEMMFVKTGTLDDTTAIEPTAHLWTESAQDWFAFPAGVSQLLQQ